MKCDGIGRDQCGVLSQVRRGKFAKNGAIEVFRDLVKRGFIEKFEGRPRLTKAGEETYQRCCRSESEEPDRVQGPTTPAKPAEAEAPKEKQIQPKATDPIEPEEPTEPERKKKKRKEERER